MKTLPASLMNAMRRFADAHYACGEFTEPYDDEGPQSYGDVHAEAEKAEAELVAEILALTGGTTP